MRPILLMIALTFAVSSLFAQNLKDTKAEEQFTKVIANFDEAYEIPVLSESKRELAQQDIYSCPTPCPLLIVRP
jgi:hypothetical protein